MIQNICKGGGADMCSSRTKWGALVLAFFLKLEGWKFVWVSQIPSRSVKYRSQTFTMTLVYFETDIL